MTSLVYPTAHKCGNWDYKTNTPTTACMMNYRSWFVLNDATPRAPIQWTNKRTSNSMCAPHIRAVRQTNPENPSGLGW